MEKLLSKDWKEKILKLKITEKISKLRIDKYLSDHVALLWVGGTDLHEAGQWRWQPSKQPVKVS